MLEAIFYGTFLDERRLTLPRLAYLALLWIAIPLWLVASLIAMLVGTMFTMGFGLLAEVADISYRRPYFTWTGDVGVHELRIEPYENAGDMPLLTARRFALDMPNWGVLLQMAGAFDLEEKGEGAHARDTLAFIDKIDHVGLALEGLQADFDDGPPEALRGFGLASAAPFEAEGCRRDRYWTAAELAGMGIGAGGTALRFTLGTDAARGEVQVRGILDSPGSSQVTFLQHYRAPRLSDFLESANEDKVITYQRIEVTDAGFTRSRDAFCAQRDGVSPKEFTERHIAAIQRRLQARGQGAGAEIERVYRAYLANGSLLVEARPSTTTRRADYRHYSRVDRQRMYNAMISSGDVAPVALVLEEVPAKPAPDGFQGSAWDLVAQEAGQPDMPAADAEPPRPASPGAHAAPIAAPAPAVPATNPLREPETLSYDDLAQHIGERMVITTVHGDKRAGRIESYSKDRIGLRVRFTGGYAIQHIERGQIRSVKAVR